MQLIDTHAHLYLKQFVDDRDEIIQNAINNNITTILLPNIDADSIESMLSLCSDYPNICYPMMGLHPCSVKEDYKKQLKVVESYLKKKSFIAIGEIGIDRYWSDEFLKEQMFSFAYQLELSLKYKLSVSIHIRNSFKEIFEVLEKFKNQSFKGVFHCFSGTQAEAEKAIKFGFYLGIGGTITFKNNLQAKFLPNIPLSKIVLETDSPYLAPHPFRGKRNESSYVKIIAEKLAETYNVSLDKIAEQTTKNALSIFRIS